MLSLLLWLLAGGLSFVLLVALQMKISDAIYTTVEDLPKPKIPSKWGG